MEFDTSIPLRKKQDFEIHSSLPFGEVHKKIYSILQGGDRKMGDGAEGQIWADYSDKFQTRHIVCDIVPDPDGTEGLFMVKLSAGRRPSYLGDVLMAVFAIGGLWGLSKMLVPAPPVFYAILMVVCFAVDGFLISKFGKPFGEEQCRVLRLQIEKAFQGEGAQVTQTAGAPTQSLPESN